MTTDPYTDADLRHEAARQYAEVLHNPDVLEVGDEMQGTPIPSRSSTEPFRWGQLSGDDFHDARNEIHELLDSAIDSSRWAVHLGACYLKQTTELAWGHGDAWDLAVQVAHRPGISEDLHKAIVGAVRGAVQLVLDNRDLNLPQAA